MNARIEALNYAVRSLGKPITNGSQRMNLIDCVWSSLGSPEDVEELKQLQFIMHQVILAVYREVKKRDPDTALWMIKSYMIDHPDYVNSNLFAKIATVMQASLVLRKNGSKIIENIESDKETTFLISKEVYRSGVEFVSAWMGWLNPAMQVFNSGTPDWRILKKPAAIKISEFEKESKGEDGVFYILFRSINKDLRNSIAHSDVYLDYRTGTVVYRNIKDGKENHMSLQDYMLQVFVMSHLPNIYIGAASAILLMENGKLEDKLKLPAISFESFSGVGLSQR